MQTILQDEQYRLIYRISYISFLSSLYALYRNHRILALVPGSVFLSSINYWYRPDYSWRRYLDMGVVQVALIYQWYTVRNAQYATPYYSLTSLGIVSYLISLYYYSNQQYWKSTYAHVALHVLANMGNIWLYSGSITALA